MQLNNILRSRKDIIFKSIFFIGLIIVILLDYIQNNNMIDKVYFLVVIVFYIRFLVMKLYQ